MKLRCIYDKEDVKVKTGLFSSEVRKQKVDGITEGKSYFGYPTAICDNSKWEGSDTSRTEIKFEDYGFLIYDDNGEWACFDLHHFAPEGLP